MRSMSNKKLTITDLSVEEVNFIITALQELPAKYANGITNKIREQCLKQVAESAAKASTDQEAPNAE